MDESTEILNELKNISQLLAEMGKANVFKVPDNYFNELDKRVLTTVFLHQDGKNKDLQVPEGYFEGLSGKIISRIKNEEIESAEEEIKSISPVLFSLKNIEVLQAPLGYFENLGKGVMSKLEDKKAKVISLSAGRKWWKYAAAAVIAGGITIGSFQIYNNSNAPDNNNQIITASADMPAYVRLSLKYNTPEQLNKGIASLSANEIADYLEKHGTIMDDELLTKGIDSTGLPAADDYLINDNTLENFLNTIDVKSSNENTQ
jgi:hypothetical protein